MIIARLSLVLVMGLLAGTAMAQTANKPLNLNLPPSYVVPATAGAGSDAPALAVASSILSPSAFLAKIGAVDPGRALVGVTVPTGTHTQANAATRSQDPPPAGRDAPGVYYGDHSGDGVADATESDAPVCDDSAYNTPQVHGSISTGIISGSHMGAGSFGGGVVTVSQAFGSCEHPRGGISISVGGTSSHGFGRHWRH